jgi:hypothetical protein
MANFSEDTLDRWRKRPSNTEQQRYEWTRNKIKDALRGHSFGGNDSVGYSIYAKGSYPNFTNVRRDSDVDIAVELTSIATEEFIHEAVSLSSERKTAATSRMGYNPYYGDYNLRMFKDEAEQVLRHVFLGSVVRADKAIKIEETNSGLKADVVVCQTLLTFFNENRIERGTRIISDGGASIHNYSKQHYDNGVAKNLATLRRYKRVVRILKHVENRMVQEGLIYEVPSFLIESIAYNVPNSHYVDNLTWNSRLRAVLETSYTANKEEDEWLEVNGIKFLFHATQKWTETQADLFLREALRYLGYRD